MTTDSIKTADWLHDDATKRVIAALEAARPGGSRFVGGCIRNTLMGRAVSDIDIATQLLPQETMAAVEAAGIRAIPTGIEHGTITAVCNHIPFEITTLRRDVETDGRRAVVAYTQDWVEDAGRRDFRLNALYADPNGHVYDPTGGLPDIAAKRVVFIGDAEQRLREDYLRALRFFRFTAWYANEIDETGLKACEDLRDGLRQIAVERIWKELIKLLDAPDPFPALSAMIRTGIMKVILPESDDGLRMARLRGLEKAEGLRFDAFQRFLSLFSRSPAIASSLARHLKVSRHERDRLTHWAKAAKPPKDTDDLKPWLYSLEGETGLDVLAWCWADGGAPGEDWAARYASAKAWQRPVFPLKGADLIALGHKPGVELGDTLKRLEAAWIANGFSMDGVE